MSWLPIVLLALAAFGIAAFVLKLERRSWMLFAAALLFGLAGYAAQGLPDMPAAPRQAAPDLARSGKVMVETRRLLFDPDASVPAHITLSDGFARQGQFQNAARLLRKETRENPKDTQGWLALANALLEHSQGQLTPASLYAYRMAERAQPGHPAVSYFLGIAFLRSGQPDETQRLWTDTLANAPADAPWRGEIEMQLERLDAMLAGRRRAPAQP